MNKVNKFYIFLVLLSSLVFAQRKEQNQSQPPSKGFMFEAVILPSETGSDCFIAYRVNYNRLVFVKDENKFISRFSVAVEAIDSASGKIYRESQNKEVTVTDYELTNAPYLYVQGVFKLTLNQGKFRILPSVLDINTGSELNFGQSRIDINSKDKGIVNPLIVKNISVENPDYVLANYEANIPFSRDTYDLIIPVIDTTFNPLDAEIWNEDSLVFKGILKDSFTSALELKEENGEIKLLASGKSPKTRNFIIKGLNERLKEGGVRIKLAYGPGTAEKTTFIKQVRWFNRPFTLLNAEYSAKMLKYIASEREVDDILKYSDFKLYQALFKFWEKYDPTPQTEFNEIMEEYYQRVDYAISNFSVIASRNGAETDRGKIYIKFGKPNEIQRTYSDSKDVKEIWNYHSPKRQFVFIDKSGLGNFVLNQSL